MLKIQKKVDCWVMVEHVGGFSWPKGPHQPIFHVYSQPVRRFARLLPGRSKQAGRTKGGRNRQVAWGTSGRSHRGGHQAVRTHATRKVGSSSVGLLQLYTREKLK